MAKKNFRLKVAVLERFGSQNQAAEELKIDYARLSRIINGWKTPSPQQKQKLEKYLGKDVFARN